jgi:hypothetical protein
MFQLQEESLKRDHARSSVTDQWNETAKAIADFKTRAMTEMNAVKQAKSLEITNERNRVRTARARHRPYSTETLQKLTSELSAITSAESKLQQVRLLSLALPDKTEDAQRALGEALADVNEAYAALPEQARSRVSLPRLPEAPQFPEHIQKAFWKELLSGSAPAVLMVFFAAILDLLPPFVRFASSPRQTLDERILNYRHWRRRLRDAIRTPLAAVYRDGVKLNLPKDDLMRIADPGPAYVVTQMMRSVLRPGGTANGALRMAGLASDAQIGAKTGTGQVADLWFVGFSKRLVVAVWVGMPRNKPTLKMAQGF